MSETFCVTTHDSQNRRLPASLSNAAPSVLVDLSQSRGCTLQEYPPRVRADNCTVGLLSGDCNHAQKSRIVRLLNGSGVLIIETGAETEPQWSSLDHEDVNVTVASISWEDYRQLFHHRRPIVVRIYAGQKPLWDPNMILVVFLSTALVMAGAGWAACNEHRSRQTSKLTEQSPHRTTKFTDHGPPLQTSELNEKSKTSQKWAAFFTFTTWISLPCAMIVLLYFCYAKTVHFFIGMFCFFGSLHLYQCLLPAWSSVVPVIYEIHLNKVPCLKTKLKLRNILLYLPCLSLGIFWAFQRHAEYAWIIQDLLGASLCIVCIKNVRVTSGKTLAAVLAFFVAYDVFFVFITPYVTEDGDSVMAKIASGASSHMDSDQASGSGPPRETLPIMFLIPILSRNPLATCGKLVFSILGLGDVFIPGLLVTFNATFDVRSGNKMVYYLASSLGYFCGVVICMIALILTSSGQPALLYLIPCTVLATVATALVRGELRELMLWSEKYPQTGHDSNVNVAKEDAEDEVEEDSLNNDQIKLVGGS